MCAHRQKKIYIAMEMLSTKECLKFTAIVSAGMMTGTALYISLVEVRSRRNLPIEAMREQWSESFNGAATFVVRIFISLHIVICTLNQYLFLYVTLCLFGGP